MIKSDNKHFVISYLPDGKGCPYFMDKDFYPELPDYDIYLKPPAINDFTSKYTVKLKAGKINGDYFIEDNLVSYDFLILCEKLNVKCISIPTDIYLSRGKRIEKKYFIFFLLEYLPILDQEKSNFVISKDLESNKLNTPDERSLSKIYYERIDKFIVKKDIKEHLFYCLEISKPVCSSTFKNSFELLGLKGIQFQEINNEYKYDAWEGW